MSAGRKNKGVTLIEVMTALCIVAVTIMTAATVITATTRSRFSQVETIEGIHSLETVKKLILCNYSYDEIKTAFKDKYTYLHTNTIKNLNSVEINILKSLQLEVDSYPFVKLQGSEGQGGTMKIIISYFYEEGNGIENVFYKGNYEEME